MINKVIYLGIILLAGISATENPYNVAQKRVEYHSELQEQKVLQHPQKQKHPQVVQRPLQQIAQQNNLQRPPKQNVQRHIEIHRQQPHIGHPHQQHGQIHQHHAKNHHNHPHLQRNFDSIKFIGPHNLPDHYFDLRWMARTTNKSLLDSIKSTYNIRPMVRDMDLSHMDDKEIFSVVMRREIAWSYPEFNEFGLMRCEDLKFRNSPFAGYIELIPDGRRISIQKFDDSISYQRVAQGAKELQSRCLIKALEKTPSPSPSPSSAPVNCKTQIPFCFSDSWRQIWWKVIE